MKLYLLLLFKLKTKTNNNFELLIKKYKHEKPKCIVIKTCISFLSFLNVFLYYFICILQHCFHCQSVELLWSVYIQGKQCFEVWLGILSCRT